MTGVIRDIVDLEKLISAGETDWEKYGMVKAVYHDGMVLFNYTAECNAKPPSEWNSFERMSRGLIMNANFGSIVAKPFSKFWNYREDYDHPDYKVAELTEKLDGSLGIIYHWKGRWHVATRGSFTSEQAKWAESYLYSNFDTHRFDPYYTILVEILYPENRIVVDYDGRQDLVMIGLTTRSWPTRDFPYKSWKLYAEMCRFNTPKVVEVNSINDVVRAVKELGSNAEGYVARMEDGTRLKFKTEEYMELHRFVSAFSFKRVLEALQTGKIKEMEELCPDIYKEQLKQYILDINTEKTLIEHEAAKAYDACETYADEVMTYYAYDENYHRTYNKFYAQFVLEHWKGISKLLFMLRDGKDITDEVFKIVSERHKAEESL